MIVKCPKSFSFPSGHASATMVTAIILFMKNRKTMWLMFLVTIFVGFTRCYLYVHYPSDIIAGVVLGLIIGIIVYIVFNKTGINAKLDRKKE